MRTSSLVLITAFMLAILLPGCNNDSTVLKQKSTHSESRQCIEPQNPYNDGGGHDAGFNWAAENGGECNGNSDSFNEGCEEYHRQLNQYDECLADNRK